MNIIIDIMIVMLVYMVGYRMGINYANNFWSGKLEEIIKEEVERRQHK